jgi:hypothetical protein
MKSIAQTQAAILEGINAAINANDEVMIDEAISSYDALVKELSRNRQYQALRECVNKVGAVQSISDLINLKSRLSLKVLEKVLGIISFNVNAIPTSKESARYGYTNRREPQNLPPNAGQSLAIARAFVAGRSDDLDGMVSAIKLFSVLGHQQAVAVVLGYAIDSELYKQDLACELFGSLKALVTDAALHSSLILVLKNRDAVVRAEFFRMAKRWESLGKTVHYTSIFKLSMLEKLKASGFADQARILANVYAQVCSKTAGDMEPCVIHRLFRLGAEPKAILVHALQNKGGSSQVYPSPVVWIEYMLTCDGPLQNMESALKGFYYNSSDRDTGFQAIKQVIDYLDRPGADSGLDREKVINKAAHLAQHIIDRRKIAGETQELNRIVEEYELPKELTRKVNRLKGAILEQDLGL